MIPHYRRIQDHILAAIDRGDLHPGDRTCSENTLAQLFSVSRMTARRALSELGDAGILERRKGHGTFVADRRPMVSVLEVRDIAGEIAERGGHYTCRVLELTSEPADPIFASRFRLAEREMLYRSCIVHLEDNKPVQYERRWVNPHLIPRYAAQDFTRGTPNAYLSRIAPLAEADHVVEATVAPPEIAQALEMERTAPCLKVTRRTRSRRGVVTFAELYHPGDRYRIGSRLESTPPGGRPTGGQREQGGGR